MGTCTPHQGSLRTGHGHSSRPASPVPGAPSRQSRGGRRGRRRDGAPCFSGLAAGSFQVCPVYRPQCGVSALPFPKLF